jgi:hypothetical protein
MAAFEWAPEGSWAKSAEKPDEACSIEPLFRIFVEMERRGLETSDEDARDALLEAQTMAIELACAVRARTLRDIVFKLALWRWDTPDLGPDADMTRNEKAAYSAFRDLVAMTGEESALTVDDIEALLGESAAEDWAAREAAG